MAKISGVIDCTYSVGNINCSFLDEEIWAGIGGLCGWNNYMIKNSYNAGIISGNITSYIDEDTYINIGSIIGENTALEDEIFNLHYYIESYTSEIGIDEKNGSYDISSKSYNELISSEFVNELNTEDDEFKIDSGNMNNGMPVLKWQESKKSLVMAVENVVQEVNVESINLNKDSVRVYVGEKEVLSATVLPDNASNKEVIWESSNLEIVRVDSGVITGINEGTAIIYAYNSDKTVSSMCSVTVLSNIREEEPKVEENRSTVQVEKKSEETKKEEKIVTNTTTTTTNANTNENTQTYNSENTAQNTNSITNESNVLEKNEEVIEKVETKKEEEVIQDNTAEEELKGIIVSDKNVFLEVGKEVLIKVKDLDNHNNNSFVWKSNNENIATVENGLVTAKSVGQTSITVTTQNGKSSATILVSVSKKISDDSSVARSVTFSEKEIVLKKGEKVDLLSKLEEKFESNEVQFYSNDKIVINIDKTTLIGKSEGSTIVTAKISNGESDICTVTVEERKFEVNVLFIIILLLIIILIIAAIVIIMYIKKKKGSSEKK